MAPSRGTCRVPGGSSMIAAVTPRPHTLVARRGTVRNDTAERKLAAGRPITRPDTETIVRHASMSHTLHLDAGGAGFLGAVSKAS